MLNFRASFITVKTSFVAKHYYAAAPESVKFLRDPHRHTFNVSVNIPVQDLDREFEFFLEREKIDEFITERFRTGEDLPYSCETMANIIACWLLEKKHTYVEITVQEDNENSATVVLSADSAELAGTQVIHFVGFPGSGKSSLANAMRAQLTAKGIQVTLTEVSDCVKALYADHMETPLADPILKQFVRSVSLATKEVAPQLHFIIGTREPHLVHENDKVIRCICQEPIRKRRYKDAGKEDLFTTADKRTRDLGISKIKYDTSVETKGTIEESLKLLNDTLIQQQKAEAAQAHKNLAPAPESVDKSAKKQP